MAESCRARYLYHESKFQVPPNFSRAHLAGGSKKSCSLWAIILKKFSFKESPNSVAGLGASDFLNHLWRRATRGDPTVMVTEW